MPGKKISAEASAFCDAVNQDNAELMETMLIRLSVEFEPDELEKLQRVGYHPVLGRNFVQKNEGVNVFKVEVKVGVVKVGVVVYVTLGPEPGKFEAYPTLDRITQAEHVAKFVEAVKRDDNGWGITGSAGLMYRGHNVFDIYVKKRFNDMVEDIIRNDDEIRMRDKCAECRQFHTRHDGACKNRAVIEALEKCAVENAVPVEEISTQEVYLGYDAAHDTFYTAWDVWGSENTGCVMIAFKINENGEVRHERSYEPGGYDREREPDEITDASNLKFYAVPKPDDKRHGPRQGKSMYQCVSTSTHCELIDIRLD